MKWGITFQILTTEVGSNDEIVVLEEVPPVQMRVGNECAPAKVLTAEAFTAVIPHCSGCGCWFVPTGMSVLSGQKNKYIRV